MYYLVDYENVNSDGLRGAECLTNKDTLIIFCNKHNRMDTALFAKIMNTGCTLRCIQLRKTGKNGLDFYIAVKIGYLKARDIHAKIAIISKDKGFTAVEDFALLYANSGVTTHKSIEDAFSVRTDVAECVESKQKYSEQHSDNTIVSLFSQYRDEIKKINHDARVAGSNSEVAPVITIQRPVETEKTTGEQKLALYRECIKKYGAKEGLEKYKAMRDSI